MPSHYKVKEYCPIVFKNIRERLSINEDSYLKSLTHGEMEPLDNTGSKSNAKFYVSYDKRYIIKTVTSEDVEGLHNMLSEYHKVFLVFICYNLIIHFIIHYSLWN